ncbi:MAG: proline--tRNA ligase [Planctomycetota bacterium]|nr:MAG: proline--tRNA ligase [Planctomycetota bacterium]
MARNITPRADDYAQWYLDVIKAAELAEHSPVRGCMVIRPEGFAVWEAIQADLDNRFKETGHVNAYFPLLIPQSFLTKEAEHVEGFAMECAIVTHSKLEKDPSGKGLRPGGKLEEPLIVRPTSETMIGHMYSQWIQSYRDLPVLINQWANVMRWEMRTRLFLRTAEFLWQEGHTAHETAEEAQEETLRMLDVYSDFVEDALALPVVKGLKSETEKFPGANATYTIEGLMQDGKALQCGTSHNLGQNFAKAFDIDFLGRDQKQHLVHTTSWGMSTRILGALIMAHSDDEGLVLPPRVAPVVAAIVPIWKKPDDRAQVAAYIETLLVRLVGQAEVDASKNRLGSNDLQQVFFDKHTHQRIVVDWRDARPGDKQYHWEQRGVPFRMEVGPRDVEKGALVLKKRLDRSKEFIDADTLSHEWLTGLLDGVQAEMFERAKVFRDENTHTASSYDELKTILAEQGGFVRAYFNQSAEREEQVKNDTKATVRCIPLEQSGGGGTCVVSGEPSETEVLFAQAY